MINNYKFPIVIYNPAAAGGRGRIHFEKYKIKLIESKLFEHIDSYETASKIDTIKKIKDVHYGKKHDLIVSIGGDGSISTICNGLMQIPKKKRLPLFPLPSGSGNSFLRDFNIYKIEDAINSYKKESPKMIDTIYIEELNGNFKWYCINVVGLGFVTDVAKFAVDHKRLGAFSYVFGILSKLGDFRPYDTKIVYDNGAKTFKSEKVYFITVSNTMYTGGNIKVAPDAKYDDGLVDVIILHEINRAEFLNGFFKAINGKHLNQKGCKYIKTGGLEIYANPSFILMPDGEIDGNSPVKISVKPKEIKFTI